MHELIATELFNRPLLVEASRLDAMAAYVLSRKGFDITVPDQPKPMAFSGSDTAVWNDNGYYIDGGVAIIDMIGTMVHRGGFMQALSGITSYSKISRRFQRAMNDSQVNAIFINADTPGGSVNGAFDLSDLIYESRDVKPVYTLAVDCLCSAGILIGSSAEKVYATQTGQIGSIGVVMKHMDISKWNAKTGINSTYIYAGDRKIDGHPDAPLSKEVMALFQVEVQKLYSMFTSVMGRNIDLTEQEVIDTQAAVYLGSDAVDIGLAVEITTSDKLLEEMKTQFGAGRPYLSLTTTKEVKTMSVAKKDKLEASAEDKGGESGVIATTENKVTTDKPVAAESEDKGTEAAADVEVSETQAAKDRFAVIMESDAAKGREKAAVRLATKTDMSAEDVIATLNDLPVEAKGSSKLDAAMDAAGGTGVGAEGEGGVKTDAETILGDYNSVRGKKA